ncbi:hypothetical protein KIPB_008741, partial [Kipferlia bialata]|eukprot:g8741.t1
MPPVPTELVQSHPAVEFWDSDGRCACEYESSLQTGRIEYNTVAALNVMLKTCDILSFAPPPLYPEMDEGYTDTETEAEADVMNETGCDTDFINETESDNDTFCETPGHPVPDGVIVIYREQVKLPFVQAADDGPGGRRLRQVMEATGFCTYRGTLVFVYRDWLYRHYLDTGRWECEIPFSEEYYGYCWISDSTYG